jgi:hypothetical protein
VRIRVRTRVVPTTGGVELMQPPTRPLVLEADRAAVAGSSATPHVDVLADHAQYARAQRDHPLA